MPATPAAEPAVPAPPVRVNFAQQLFECNATRTGKPAFVDDLGPLSYGALEDRVRRLAAGLRELGIRRQVRVLLLMLHGADWFVSFLGAMHAGLVPVAVNTLLTADGAELNSFVKERLAPYKYPRFIEFVADLPKTATGKIHRFKLRELEAARSATTQATP